ncbi:MAG: NIPSNAP family protein, partial [Verrucomicrobia bacterium]|nr:NIPSNAP family protein [Verrucomicrobiota bacterium]
MQTALLLASILAFTAVAAPAAEKDTRCFEMRVYYAPPGKLDDLHARFRDHTCKLFEKHGITNLGYFVPLDNTNNTLIYFLPYPSREARDKSWKEFFADPDWQKAAKASEVNGKLVAKVETSFLNATDFSPEIKPLSVGDRVFELRTYTTEAGRLEALNTRFREREAKLFEKHGIVNIAYWNLMKDQKGAENTFTYLISHKSVDAAKASFDAFRKDPEWTAVRKASEEKAGGPLTVKDG